MNNTTQDTTANRTATANYRPKLAFYHPSVRGTGAAVCFELHPAHDDVSGSIFATFARQRQAGAPSSEGVNFPSFDWANRVIVKLDTGDLSQMLQVFRGMEESIADGRGLFHAMPNCTTVIRLAHRIEPAPGYLLEVSRKANGGEPNRIGILLSPTEALTFALAVEQSMAFLAFGLPRVIPRAFAQQKAAGE